MEGLVNTAHSIMFDVGVQSQGIALIQEEIVAAGKLAERIQILEEEKTLAHTFTAAVVSHLPADQQTGPIVKWASDIDTLFNYSD